MVIPSRKFFVVTCYLETGRGFPDDCMRGSGAVHIISISAPSAPGGVMVLASRRIASICPVLRGLCYAGLSIPFPAATPDKTS